MVFFKIGALRLIRRLAFYMTNAGQAFVHVASAIHAALICSCDQC